MNAGRSKRSKSALKSDASALRGRGMPDQADLDALRGLDCNALLAELHSASAPRRSAAVRLLAGGGQSVEPSSTLDPNLAETLLNALVKEKALYTRLEMCAALERGDGEVAALMAARLGSIGTNQYRELPGPDQVSKKKSFPLPRDIIARSLGRMNRVALPVLLKVLSQVRDKKRPKP